MALDGFLRMPAALRKSRRGGRKGRSELYFRVKRFLDSEEVLESGPFLAPVKEAREDSLERRRILKAEELVGLGYRRKAAMRLRSNDELIGGAYGVTREEVSQELADQDGAGEG